jgi:REP element-mobilizing transposase RayT
MPQPLSSVLIHLVYSTKNREPFIHESNEPGLHAYLATVFKSLQSPAIVIGGTADHIHCLFNLSRTVSIAAVVEETKTDSSRWIKKEDRSLRSFACQKGYGAFSVSQSKVEEVKKYIQNQKEHHADYGFQDEFRRLLRKYKVEFDERYVWD